MQQSDIQRIRDALRDFKFRELFIDGLGWNWPNVPRQLELDLGLARYQQRQIAQLGGATGGVAVFEIELDTGTLPDAKMRAAIAKDIAGRSYENLLIFLDKAHAQSLWYWVKRDGTRRMPRNHYYFRHQPTDLFLSNISAMAVDISELDADGNLPLPEATRRLREALDVEQVTRKFFTDYEQIHKHLLLQIKGIADERDLRWYASALLNRLMFVYFLQRKGFLDNGDFDYLQERRKKHQHETFYNTFLHTLFFEGFAKPESERPVGTQHVIGTIKYLNGGLFVRHPVEAKYGTAITIPDAAFDDILALFKKYTWNLDDAPNGKSDEIRPEVLGYIFEKYINQKAFGAYYTRAEITEYLCDQTIDRLILEKINVEAVPGIAPARHFETLVDLLQNLDASLCWSLLQILPSLSLLDPSCGSGAFLVAALQKLLNVYTAVYGYVQMQGDRVLRGGLESIRAQHPSLSYYLKKKIITDNLFGVDLMPEAVEIARLRLFLALAASAQYVDELEPLPNIDFNILAGNSLLGMLRVDETEYDKQASLLHKSYRALVNEKNVLVAAYRSLALQSDELEQKRQTIQQHRDEANNQLNELLLDEFKRLRVRYEQATWDAGSGRAGKATKRAVQIGDIETLTPFHWGYEFDQILNERGGFDAILTNPPWEIFKPQAKEFFAEYDKLVTKNKMSIKEFEQQRDRLLQQPDVREAWLRYQSRFPHQSEYYRKAPEYANQISVVNGKKQGTDINLYKLFVERCYALLRAGGQCGIVLPSGIYTDLGTKQLREMLFGHTQVQALFGMENRKAIFEGVDSRFKFVVLTFEKGGTTASFPAAFMRLDVNDLKDFPQQRALPMPIELIRRLSPDSLSVMEFKSAQDVEIAEKVARFPPLNEHIANNWNISFTQEIHMTNDSHLFRTSVAPNLVPLVQGGMFHQFQYPFAPPKYWIDLTEGRAEVIGKFKDVGQELSYQDYRIAHRRIGRNTDTRTLIATVLPPNRFCADTAQSVRNLLPYDVSLFIVALFNSFVADYQMRQRVTAHLDMHFMYTLKIPRLTERDAQFAPIVERAAKLICTTPEYDALASEVGLGSHAAGVTDDAARAQLRAELDAMIAHLYGLTEEELIHILGSFPLVAQAQKDAVLTEFRRRAPQPDDAQVAALIAAGESDAVEFKESAVWNAHTGKKDGMLTDPIVKAVAAFLNDRAGGSVFIGANARWQVVGIAADIAAASPKRDIDSYERAVRTALSARLGGHNSPYYRFSFHHVGAQQVLRIAVSPAPAPVYVDGELYIRDGGGKKKLSAQEALAYVARRWR